eukprot:augustus_masked-scaffold_52-processed-gene-1.22-mRNA-1 protein AED:1.00 eAED:1.00 QI:0/-1/0/0/-1/1/1/0/1020
MSGETQQVKLLERGHEYKAWKIRTKATLMEKDLWKVIEEQKKKFKEAADSEINMNVTETKNNGKALSIILSRIGDRMVEKLDSCEIAYLVWRKLENLFKVDDREARRRCLELMKRPIGSKRAAKVEDFDTNLRRYISAGGEMDEDLRITKLLEVIQDDRVNVLRIAAEAQPEVFNYEKVFNKLIHICNTLDRERPFLGRNSRGSYRGRGRGNYRKGNPGRRICYHCREPGHIRAQCPKLNCENCGGTGHDEHECTKPKIKKEHRANMAKKTKSKQEDDIYSDYGSTYSEKSDKRTIYSNKTAMVGIFNTKNNEKQNKNQKTGEKENKKDINNAKKEGFIEFLWDSGASSHLLSIKYLKYMENVEKVEPEVLDGAVATTKLSLKGDIIIEIGKKPIKLKDVYIVDNDRNIALLSIGKINIDQNFMTTISGKELTVKNRKGETIEKIRAEGNLFKKKMKVLKRKTFEEEDKNKFTWHKFFGHSSKQLLQKTLKYYNIKDTERNTNEACITCAKTKDTRVPISTRREETSTKALERIYADTLEIPKRSEIGYKGCVVLVDDFSKYRFMKMYRKKGSASRIVIEMLKYIESKTERKIKMFYSDQGKEFVNSKVIQFLKENNIERRYSAKYTPEHNGAAERTNRIIISGIKIFLHQAGLPMKYWTYAAQEFIRVKNLAINSVREKTPYELLFGKKPKLKYNFTFGERVTYIDKKITNKIEPKNKFGIYLGKSTVSSESNVLDDITRKVITTREIRNLKRGTTSGKRPKTTDENNKENQRQNKPARQYQETATYQQFMDIRTEKNNEMPHHWIQRRNPNRTARPRSYKLARKTENYRLAEQLNKLRIHHHQVFKAVNLKNKKEPKKLKQAFQTRDKENWLKAYMKEVDKFKQVAKCRLVPRTNIPKQQNTVRFLELFNKKIDNVTGKRIFKDRFAADGSKLEPEEDVYSPVSNKEIIRIFIALSTAQNKTIWQMDVSSAYLNANLIKKRYFELPQLFRKKRSKFVWESKKAIYGLKESGRAWYLNL